MILDLPYTSGLSVVMFPGSQVKLSHKSFFSDWISCDMNLPSLKIEKFVTGDGRSVPLLLTGNGTESEALNQTVIENCVYRKKQQFLCMQ